MGSYSLVVKGTDPPYQAPQHHGEKISTTVLSLTTTVSKGRVPHMKLSYKVINITVIYKGLASKISGYIASRVSSNLNSASHTLCPVKYNVPRRDIIGALYIVINVWQWFLTLFLLRIIHQPFLSECS